jgi:hypothetical protein
LGPAGASATEVCIISGTLFRLGSRSRAAVHTAATYGFMGEQKRECHWLEPTGSPIRCAKSVPTRPEAAKLAHAHEMSAFLQSHDSEVLIDGMDKTAQGGNNTGKDS